MSPETRPEPMEFDFLPPPPVKNVSFRSCRQSDFTGLTHGGQVSPGDMAISLSRSRPRRVPPLPLVSRSAGGTSSGRVTGARGDRARPITAPCHTCAFVSQTWTSACRSRRRARRRAGTWTADSRADVRPDSCWTPRTTARAGTWTNARSGSTYASSCASTRTGRTSAVAGPVTGRSATVVWVSEISRRVFPGGRGEETRTRRGGARRGRGREGGGWRGDGRERRGGRRGRAEDFRKPFFLGNSCEQRIRICIRRGCSRHVFQMKFPNS